jgi:flagellar basal-body rod modification protein FlgD
MNIASTSAALTGTTGTSATTGPNGAAGTAGTASAPPVGTKDEFLKLFVAQLENQNPLDPQDGADFVAQLAQFSSVEQAAKTNERLEQILAGQMSASNASLAGFVGKTGTFAGDAFTVSGRGEGMPALGLDLGQQASKVRVVIRDATGHQIKAIDLGPQSAGRISVPWDGKTDLHGDLTQGTYTVEVTATGTDGKSAVTSTTLMSGLIEAIDFFDGSPRLRLGAVSASPSDILSIE